MRNLLTLLISLFILIGCGSSVPMLKPYKLDIQQGNLVTSKMLLQLKPGMTKSQVRYIMGTPLIVDSFHKDRWDYFYQMRQGGKIIEQRRVILDFEKDLLTKVRGDVVPQGSAGAVSGDVTTGAKSTAELLKEKEEDKGLLDRFKFWKKDETPAETPMEAPKAAEPPKPKEAEKSWTDKLKFWKKDESTATKPVEAPNEVVNKPAAPAAAEVPSQSEDAPSILAVPIGADVVTQPVADTPKQAESEPPESPAPELVKSAPAPEPEPAPAKVVVPEPVPTAPPVKPAQPMAEKKQDGKMIFRIDRTIKPEALEQQSVQSAPEPVAEIPADKPIEKSAKSKKKAVEEPLPAETEPGFFDRMLEKIGF